MQFLYDYGEVLFCIGPVFLIIAIIFAGLIWNNLPSYEKKKADTSDDKPE